MKFRNNEHEKIFYLLLAKCRRQDCEVQSVVYLLALVCEDEKQAEDCFDFNNLLIKKGSLRKGWQTSGSITAIKLAFSLWNPNNVANVGSLFGFGYDSYLLEAIRIRFEIIEENENEEK